jgi:hypothetical protein
MLHVVMVLCTALAESVAASVHATPSGLSCATQAARDDHLGKRA